MIKQLNHIAIICTNINQSKYFYCEILGFKIIRENFRAERNSYKVDIAVNSNYLIELFSFPNPPQRQSYPEATGLRHLAFSIDNFAETLQNLSDKGIVYEPVRVDEFTGKKFTFIEDPDQLPIELVEE